MIRIVEPRFRWELILLKPLHFIEPCELAVNRPRNKVVAPRLNGCMLELEIHHAPTGTRRILLFNSSTVTCLIRRPTMFDSLDETMKKDAKESTSNSERMMVWLAVVAASVLVFGGLYFGVRVLG